MSAAMQEDPYENVQFCPCGHSYRMRREEIIAKGGQRQLDSIAAGTKLDAVTFPSVVCEECKATSSFDRDY